LKKGAVGFEVVELIGALDPAGAQDFKFG